MSTFGTALKILVTSVIALLALGQVLRAEDLRLRSIFDFGGFSASDIYSYSQILTDFQDAEDLVYYRITQKFNYKANKTWTFGLHPVLNSLKKGPGIDWKDYYALDFEANPNWALGDGFSLSMRNRLALIWKDGFDDDAVIRFRQRTKFTWKLPNKPLGFTAFSVANEVFWEDDREMITKNRIFPASLSFSPKEGIKSSISYGYFSDRIGTTNDWKGRHVIQFFTRF